MFLNGFLLKTLMEGESEKNKNTSAEDLIENNEEYGDKRGKLTQKLRKNPWIISTLVLGIVILILILGNFSGGISKGDAEKLLQSYLINAGANIADIEIKDVASQSGLYIVSFDYKGQPYPMPFSITKDGKFICSMSALTPAEEESGTTETEVPKSDKPKVELFIWSYCPYGVQAQWPLAEVAKLLSGSADFSTALYYDGHGAFETQQNKIQECIQELEPGKYWNYAAKFVTDIYPKCGASKDIACDKTESVKLMTSLGINSEAVLSCVTTKGESLIEAASTAAQDYGVTGSPTLFINGVKVNVARNAEAFKTAVCDAFNTAPAACTTTLDSSAAAAAGNC